MSAWTMWIIWLQNKSAEPNQENKYVFVCVHRTHHGSAKSDSYTWGALCSGHLAEILQWNQLLTHFLCPADHCFSIQVPVNLPKLPVKLPFLVLVHVHTLVYSHRSTNAQTHSHIHTHTHTDMHSHAHIQAHPHTEGESCTLSTSKVWDQGNRCLW